MPGRDLSEDRAKMRDLARRAAVLAWVEPEDVEHVLEGMKNMDWDEPLRYPKSAYCHEKLDRWKGKFPGVKHDISNPARQRKSVGTRRVGTKGRKMPTRGSCTNCEHAVVLVDNMVDKNWPLYIDKLVITEWP